MKKEKRELKKGIFARVEICPKCEDEWIDVKVAVKEKKIIIEAA